MQDDLRSVPVLLHVEDDLSLDDSRDSRDVSFSILPSRVILDGFGNDNMAAGNLDGNVDVGCLHRITRFVVGYIWKPSPR
jgi:hypothetical protein